MGCAGPGLLNMCRSGTPGAAPAPLFPSFPTPPLNLVDVSLDVSLPPSSHLPMVLPRPLGTFLGTPGPPQTLVDLLGDPWSSPDLHRLLVLPRPLWTFLWTPSPLQTLVDLLVDPMSSLDPLLTLNSTFSQLQTVNSSAFRKFPNKCDFGARAVLILACPSVDQLLQMRGMGLPRLCDPQHSRKQPWVICKFSM